MQSPSGYVEGSWLALSTEERRAARAKMERWAKSANVQPYTGRGRLCLTKILKPTHRCTSPYSCWEGPAVPESYLPLDHQEWWQHERRRFVVTAHPYSLGGLPKLRRWCSANGVGLFVGGKDESWYFEGSTYLIVVGAE